MPLTLPSHEESQKEGQIPGLKLGLSIGNDTVALAFQVTWGKTGRGRASPPIKMERWRNDSEHKGVVLRGKTALF